MDTNGPPRAQNGLAVYNNIIYYMDIDKAVTEGNGLDIK